MDGSVVGQLELDGVEVGIATQGHGAAEDDSLGDPFVLTPSPPAFAEQALILSQRKREIGRLSLGERGPTRKGPADRIMLDVRLAAQAVDDPKTHQYEPVESTYRTGFELSEDFETAP